MSLLPRFWELGRTVAWVTEMLLELCLVSNIRRGVTVFYNLSPGHEKTYLDSNSLYSAASTVFNLDFHKTILLNAEETGYNYVGI